MCRSCSQRNLWRATANNEMTKRYVTAIRQRGWPRQSSERSSPSPFDSVLDLISSIVSTRCDSAILFPQTHPTSFPNWKSVTSYSLPHCGHGIDIEFLLRRLWPGIQAPRRRRLQALRCPESSPIVEDFGRRCGLWLRPFLRRTCGRSANAIRPWPSVASIRLHPLR